MSKIKVAIVDDHELARNSLVTLLKSEADIEIVQIAVNGQDIINQLETTQYKQFIKVGITCLMK